MTDQATNTNQGIGVQDDAPARRSEGIEKALKRLKRERQELREEARALRARLATFEGANPGRQNTHEDSEPLIGDFNNSDDYWRAHREWELRSEGVQNDDDRRQTRKQQPQPSIQQNLSHDARRAAQVIFDVINDSPDADRLWVNWVENKKLNLPEQMVIAIADSDDPAKVIEALGENPALNNRISRLSQAAMQEAIDKLSWGKTETAQATSQGKVRRNTEKPEPIRPERSGDDGSPIRNAVVDTTGMSASEYEAYRYGTAMPRRPNEW